MSSGDAVFRRIQSVARSAAATSGTSAPTQEYLIRHTLESFLDRLIRTSHAGDFVLKGGILLAAYGVRRATKDADVTPVVERLCCGLHRRVDVRRLREQHVGLLLTRRRVPHDPLPG